MSRIIRSSTPGKDREKLSKAIVVTIRSFMQQEAPDQSTNDMIAFIILALQEISAGIDNSVAAWEKRGYWVKADKYRLEWQWTAEMSKVLKLAFSQKDWEKITAYLVEIMGKFSKIKVSSQHRMGKPWLNAHKNYNDLVK